MKAEIVLKDGIVSAIKSLYGQDIDSRSVQLQATRKEFEGDLTVVVFPYLKMSRKKPEDTASEIGEWLKNNVAAVKAFNVVKGFLNISLSSDLWLELLDEMAKNEDYGFSSPSDSSELVMVEYSSPNTNKPLHLGHVRNNLLGYSLSLILAANGKKVVKTNIVNDRGIHICKSMLAWQKWGNGETPESSGKKGDHLIGDYYVLFDVHYKDEIKKLMEEKHISEEEAEAQSSLMAEAREMLRKWEAGDPEIRSLWATMNSWVYDGFAKTYEALGVSFDKIYYESDTYLEGKELVLEGLKKGIMYRRPDGSVWIDLKEDGLDEKLLLRSDGTSVYMTQDIGTAKLRYLDYPIDNMVYVVGNEQNYHFQVLSLILDKLGFKWGKDLKHFSYGMVELPNGKMKSREGTVVDADDLIAGMIADARRSIDERFNDVSNNAKTAERFKDSSEEEMAEISRIVGLGALKYFLLKVDPKRNMLFNPEESIDFNGNTGPFIQYSYARIRSLLRRAGVSDVNEISLNHDVTLSDKEQTLIQKMADFGSVVKEAGTNYSPALIANYAYDLAKEYNQFYHDFPVLKEENEALKALRLKISGVAARTIRKAVSLLGMEVPEKM